MTATDARRVRLRLQRPPTPAEAHSAVINLLVSKGYLAQRYPLVQRAFDYALLAALTAAPPAPLLPPKEP